ncbi:MAG: hypothetical protein QQN63_00970 [Nitrosopumilus sp.]
MDHKLTVRLAKLAEEAGISDQIMDGGDYSGTYLKVAAANDDTHLAISPMTDLIPKGDGTMVLLLGIRLRAGWNCYFGGNEPKVQPLYHENSVALLKKWYKTNSKHVFWTKEDPHRLSCELVGTVTLDGLERNSFSEHPVHEAPNYIMELIKEGGLEIINEEKIIQVISQYNDIILSESVSFLKPVDPEAPHYTDNVIPFRK